MGPTLTQWLVPWHLNGTLSLPQHFCKKTCSERILDTVFFLHRYITQPTVTPEDQLIKAVGDLLSALRGQTNEKGRKEMAALKRLQAFLTTQQCPSKRRIRQLPSRTPYQNQGCQETQLAYSNHQRISPQLQGC